MTRDKKRVNQRNTHCMHDQVKASAQDSATIIPMLGLGLGFRTRVYKFIIGTVV
jgi:hypothetical protein